MELRLVNRRGLDGVEICKSCSDVMEFIITYLGANLPGICHMPSSVLTIPILVHTIDTFLLAC